MCKYWYVILSILICQFLAAEPFCPENYNVEMQNPDLDPDYGDVCRHDNDDHYECPIGCVKPSPEQAPWCKVTGLSIPCRFQGI